MILKDAPYKWESIATNIMDFGPSQEDDMQGAVTLYNLEIDLIQGESASSPRLYNSAIKKYTIQLDKLKNCFDIWERTLCSHS